MAYVLGRLRTAVTPFMDDIIAFAAGALDGFLMTKGATEGWATVAFLAKNIGVPVADIFMRGTLPRGLVHECEGMLGATIIGLLMRYIGGAPPEAEGESAEEHL